MHPPGWESTWKVPDLPLMHHRSIRRAPQPSLFLRCSLTLACFNSLRAPRHHLEAHSRTSRKPRRSNFELFTLHMLPHHVKLRQNSPTTQNQQLPIVSSYEVMFFLDSAIHRWISVRYPAVHSTNVIVPTGDLRIRSPHGNTEDKNAH
ncbi:hypothetical protein HYPSUDRAFT_340223 [Hypholoma sublateritium FD-334 SS-4]|uniref:Uncharacterized protein n=1 Tax=Hypholoma sublateritium (strain FD-334 SS-4) TaxID=945553 RepID=A0A0D2Q312_HYPSF|nr:hypothetical protein HYPSUDRAFT_340223 [Hypholoma sublateritium FD-334 SS-4]